MRVSGPPAVAAWAGSSSRQLVLHWVGVGQLDW